MVKTGIQGVNWGGSCDHQHLIHTLETIGIIFVVVMERYFIKTYRYSKNFSILTI